MKSRRKLKGTSTAPVTGYVPVPLHEPSMWLRTAVRDLMADLPTFHSGTLVVPLSGHTLEGTREDRSCDRCDRYVAPGKGNLYPGTWLTKTPAGGAVLVTIGLCLGCAEAEIPGWGEL